MTQEQRELAAEREKVKKLTHDAEQREQERQAELNQQRASQLQKRVENELVAAAKRAGMGLGDDAFFAIYKSFEDAFELGLLPTDEMGLQPHHADRIVEDAMAKIEAERKSVRENCLKLKGQALVDFMGQEAIDACAAVKLEQVRARRGQQAKAPGAPPPPAAQPRPSSYITSAEADAQVKKLVGR
jgi:hypothetical protein